MAFTGTYEGIDKIGVPGPVLPHTSQHGKYEEAGLGTFGHRQLEAVLGLPYDIHRVEFLELTV